MIVAAAASYPVTYIQTNLQQGQQEVSPQQYRLLLQQPLAQVYQQEPQTQTQTLIYQQQPQQVRAQTQSQAEPQTQTLIYQQQQPQQIQPQRQTQVYGATPLKARPVPPQQAGGQPLQDPEDYDVSSNNTFMTGLYRAGWLSRYSDWLWAGRSGDRISVGTRFSVPVQTFPRAHPASCMGTGSFPGVKSGRGVRLNPQPCLVPWSRKSRAIHLLSIWAVRPVQSLSACTVQLYLYSPYGPYRLYRASVSVQYSYTSTPPMGHTACTEPQCLYSRVIPLLPLWAVRPVQSLSTCTVQLYLYSPYGPYGLYRASLPVEGCTLHFTVLYSVSN